MGVFNETLGDNDFASIFSSVAEDRRIAEERRQADLLLKLLDEMEQRDERKRSVQGKEPKIEYLRVAPNGDVIHDKKIDDDKRNRVMTVDQLPKESEYEMLFGKPPEIEPQLKVETGMRLKDGKPFQNIKFEDISLFSLGPGVRFETLMVICAALFFVFVLVLKYVRLRQARKQRERHMESQQRMHNERMQQNNMNIEQEVERRVRERLSVILATVNNSCQ